MGRVRHRSIDFTALANTRKCNDNLPFTKGRQHGRTSPAVGSSARFLGICWKSALKHRLVAIRRI